MPTTSRRPVVLSVLCVAVLLEVASRPAAQTPEPRDAVVLKSVPAPDALRGLTSAGGHLWSIDGKKNQLLQIDPADGHVVSTRRLEVRGVRGLSWDGGAFWGIGADGRALNRLDVTSGKRLEHFDFWPDSSPRGYGDPPSPADSPLSWRALAWDGDYLWVAYEQQTKWGAGLVRMDVSLGRGVGRIAALGIPLALASDGKWLWMATYDEGGRSAVLVRWKIPDSAARVGASYQAMMQTRAIVARLPGKEPAGLAVDGGALWYADRRLQRLVQLQLPNGY